MKKLFNQIRNIFAEAFRSVRPEDLAAIESVPGAIVTLAYSNAN